jgi:hypothetical protein
MVRARRFEMAVVVGRAIVLLFKGVLIETPALSLLFDGRLVFGIDPGGQTRVAPWLE